MEILLQGLKNQQVVKSRAEHGANELSQKKPKSFLKKLLENTADPMIKILMFALVINVVFLFSQSSWYESLGIALTIVITILVSTFSEYGSETAFEKIKSEAAKIMCRVRRDGVTVLLGIGELVVGDIVLLSAGDKVPADGEILQGSIEVDQSALNGESKETKKYPSNSGGQGFLNPKLLFRGTVVTGGEAVMRVDRVGDSTFYGKLAAEIQEETRQSPLKLRLEKLAKNISVYGYVGAVVVAVAYLFNMIFLRNKFDFVLIGKMLGDTQQLLRLFFNAVTLAVTVIVMAVPEGLPMMITLVLSNNMRRMMKDNVLVRKLNGIETAGSMNILFTDKTGTLTNGKLDVVEVLLGNGLTLGSSAVDKHQKLAELVKLSLIYNNGSEYSNKAIGGNVTDRSLMEYAQKLKCKAPHCKKVFTQPFDSVNKYMLTRLDSGMLLVKGATEKVIGKCTHFYDQNGEIKAFSAGVLAKLIDQKSKASMRIIAVAVGKQDDLSNLTLVACVGLKDQIRSEAVKGVKQVQSAGIQTVMITGDSLATATAIAKETGIISSDGDVCLTSEEMEKLSDERLKEILPSLRVVARALPTDKSRLINIAQSLDLVAGMTGDGVNDAPALKKADIGFVMGSGTEVAKEAGDVIILDDNISSISRAVSYGRTIFKSIRKFIIFQLTINICAMAISVIAPLLDIETPITMIQMLWINLVMDTLAGIAFGGERPRVKYMTEPPKRRDEPIINKYMWQQVVFSGFYICMLSLFFLKSRLFGRVFEGKSTAYIMTAFFALFMFTAIFNSLNARTHEINLLSYLSLNKQFIWIMSSVAVIQCLLIYFGGGIFRTEPLEFVHLVMVVCMSMAVIPLDIIRKVLCAKNGVLQGT